MKIAIIGGGITGLTTALALHKVGITPVVYERATALNEIGAGVWLQPNAIQVLQWLGLENEIRQAGCVLNKMEICDPQIKPVKKMKEAVVEDQYGNRTIAIHRGKLQTILYQAFEKVGKVHLGMNYKSHRSTDNIYQIEFESSSTSADIILGADGIHSKVRRTLGLPSNYRYSEQICSRGISKIQLPDALKNEGKELWGKNIRFGFSEISDGLVYFFTVVNHKQCPKGITSENLANTFQNFHPIVSEIIRASNDIFTTELTDLTRLDTWHQGSVCLLGDAAHATTPNMGQGACQGIEDAFHLAHFIQQMEGPMDQVFEKFETSRRKKVDYVVNNSWRFGKMVHHPISQSFLKLIMKVTPEKVMSQQMNQLYSL